MENIQELNPHYIDYVYTDPVRVWQNTKIKYDPFFVQSK